MRGVRDLQNIMDMEGGTVAVRTGSHGVALQVALPEPVKGVKGVGCAVTSAGDLDAGADVLLRVLEAGVAPLEDVEDFGGDLAAGDCSRCGCPVVFVASDSPVPIVCPSCVYEETCAERVSLALALGLAASRLEEQSDDPEVAAVVEELERLSDLLRERLRASRPDDADDAGVPVR